MGKLLRAQHLLNSGAPTQGSRAQAQAGFRAHRSVNHNLFALQHAIDKSRRNRMPLYCCFVDLTAAFDRVPRSLLWERLRSCGVSGQMLAAIQALYSDAHIVINIDGCIGESATVLSGVKQGCPLSPTLFGIFIDAIHFISACLDCNNDMVGAV